jgi:general secretion pathway protein H
MSFSTHQHRRSRARGLTLVEVLIVIALIGVLTGAVVFGSGLLAGNRQRAAAMLIITGVRLGLTHANATGRPVRMVFDLDDDTVSLQETNGRMLRVKDKGASTGAGAEPATSAERQAEQESERILDGPRPPRPEFTPIKSFDRDTKDPKKGRSLGRDIEFREVQTDHDDQPRKKGNAYLYMWPGGETERAVIQLHEKGQNGDDDGLTVVVSPLTGRAAIRRGRIDLDTLKADTVFGQTKDDEL